jgi:hypothetical protein
MTASGVLGISLTCGYINLTALFFIFLLCFVSCKRLDALICLMSRNTAANTLQIRSLLPVALKSSTYYRERSITAKVVYLLTLSVVLFLFKTQCFGDWIPFQEQQYLY